MRCVSAGRFSQSAPRPPLGPLLLFRKTAARGPKEARDGRRRWRIPHSAAGERVPPTRPVGARAARNPGLRILRAAPFAAGSSPLTSKIGSGPKFTQTGCTKLPAQDVCFSRAQPLEDLAHVGATACEDKGAKATQPLVKMLLSEWDLRPDCFPCTSWCHSDDPQETSYRKDEHEMWRFKSSAAVWKAAIAPDGRL